MTLLHECNKVSDLNSMIQIFSRHQRDHAAMQRFDAKMENHLTQPSAEKCLLANFVLFLSYCTVVPIFLN